MGIAEAISDSAAARDFSSPGEVSKTGDENKIASIADWIPEFLKPHGESGSCSPSPLYDHAVSLARDLYYDQPKASQLADYKNKFNCQIKNDEDAVKYANEALHTIGDPYTRVLSKTQADEMSVSIKGDAQIVGIGVSLGLQKHARLGDSSYAVVGGVFPGTPAEKAGLKPGDIILQIGDKSTKDMPMQQVQSLVRGADGSNLQLKIERDGTMLDINATRAKVEVPAVIDKNLGDIEYVRLIDFMNDKTDTSLKTAILQHPTAKAFIIDVRGNPGGRVDEMLQTVELLMKSGNVYAEQTRMPGGAFNESVDLTDTNLKKTSEGSLFAQTSERNRYMLNGRPMVLLVDQYSASASELLAGALKDNGAATLVGTRTFGKGVGQAIIPIENGAMVAVTNTRFTNPGGNWSGDGNQRRIGIEPDIVVQNEQNSVPLTPNDMQFQIALAKARSLAGLDVSTPGSGSIGKPSKSSSWITDRPNVFTPLTPRVPNFAPTVPFLQRMRELEQLQRSSWNERRDDVQSFSP